MLLFFAVETQIVKDLNLEKICDYNKLFALAKTAVSDPSHKNE